MNNEEWNAIVKVLASTVKDLRQTLGWSQDKLGKRAGTSQGGVSRIESGNMQKVPFHTVVAICRALDVGAKTLDTPLSGWTTALLDFTRTANGEVMQPMDPDLAYISRAFNKMGPNHKAAFVELTRAAIKLVEAHEPRQPPTPLHVCANSCTEHHDSTS